MTSLTIHSQPSPNQRLQDLHSLAKKMEAQLLAEMLTSAGVGKPSESFGGGVGEEQFSSFLTQEYATAAVDAGGIGISETIFNALAKREDLT